MKKDVIISIVGTQLFEDNEPEKVELTTDGTYERSGDGCLLSYRESEVTGLEGTTTSFRVNGDGGVVLSREGSVSSQMIFEEGRKHLSLYDMGFGAITVGVTTRKLRTEMSDASGSIDVDYAIEIDHTIAGENTFCVKFNEVRPR